MPEFTLLCMHGVAGSHAEWSGVADRLRGRAVVIGEPPACGRVVVVGHSQGGLRALQLAAVQRARVQAVILTGSFFPPARGGRTLIASAADFARHRAMYAAQVLGRRRIPRPTRSAAGQLRGMAGFALRPPRWHALAATVACPVLVIHGDRDHLVPVAFARAAASAHPGWDYRELPGAGHFAHRDQPAEWAAVVLAWPRLLGRRDQ